MTAYERSMAELVGRVEALEKSVSDIARMLASVVIGQQGTLEATKPGPDDIARITRRQICTLIKRVHRLECLSNAELSEEQFAELELMNGDRDKPWPH